MIFSIIFNMVQIIVKLKLLKNNSNYEDWSDTIKLYLEIEDPWDVAEPEWEQQSPHYDFSVSCDQEALSEIIGINTTK